MNEATPPEPIDPELEARIVALVLGEASETERDQLHRIIEERSELKALKEKFELVHRLMGDVGSGEYPAEQKDWKLGSEKRRNVMAVIDGEVPETQLARPHGITGRLLPENGLWEYRKVAVALCLAGSILMAAVGMMMTQTIKSNARARVRVASERTNSSVDAPRALRNGGRSSSIQDFTVDVEAGGRNPQDESSGPQAVSREKAEAPESSLSAISGTLGADSGLPSPYYLQDDVQYFPPSAEFEVVDEMVLSDSAMPADPTSNASNGSTFAFGGAARFDSGPGESQSPKQQGDAQGLPAINGATNARRYAADSARVPSAGKAIAVDREGERGQADQSFGRPSEPMIAADDAGAAGQKPVDTTDSLGFALPGGRSGSLPTPKNQPTQFRRDLGERETRVDQRALGLEARIDGNRLNGDASSLSYRKGASSTVEGEETDDQKLGRGSGGEKGRASKLPEPEAAFEGERGDSIGVPTGRQTDRPELLKRLSSKTSAAGLNEMDAAREAFSTFSLHVGDVSFKLAQAALAKGEWPEAATIRIEEFVNALDYGDPLPARGERISCLVEQSIHPFLQQRNLLRVSLRTAAAGRASSTPLRLTLLLDNSGSMERIDRQQTLRRAVALLAEQLNPSDQVTLISFARQPRLLADKVAGAQTQQLVELVENLPSEGGTNIESALRLALEKAQEQLTAGAQNRIVLLTDGAVNLGDADPERLSRLITTIRDAGIAFDAAGIIAEGLNDEILEALTRQGDGRYYLLDSLDDADDGFARQIAGALRPSAKNVKVQIEFNPQRVGRYKLLGFDKHLLRREDFRNDNVDAAEMAAAEAGVAVYQFESRPDGVGDVGSVSVRFRDLSTGRMVENRWPIPYQPEAPRPDQAAPSLRIATAAALFAAKLREEPLGENVDLKTLSDLLAGLPKRERNAKRVQNLQLMIAQARQILGN